MRFHAVIATVGALVNAAPTLRGPRGASTNSTMYSFADSCNTYTVHQVSDDVWLGAYCRNHDGAWPYSRINLNHCITNNMGKMEAREDGYFGVSCNRMLFHGSHPVLYAFCNNGRYPEETTIDTGNFIDNDDGSLRCYNYHGE
ncbi:hypothetical protein EKO27_g1242 [Xylaria grammica]|uniref:Cyanovirin-N domain-containing protein n=1 Tax=Xylaria grammica TaxID=363999 RepID=A0A439DHG9_9PEZI|nr:hypothetical protein EKO27_g1242 [Xylaria grammica]